MIHASVAAISSGVTLEKSVPFGCFRLDQPIHVLVAAPLPGGIRVAVVHLCPLAVNQAGTLDLVRHCKFGSVVHGDALIYSAKLLCAQLSLYGIQCRTVVSARRFGTRMIFSFLVLRSVSTSKAVVLFFLPGIYRVHFPVSKFFSALDFFRAFFNAFSRRCTGLPFSSSPFYIHFYVHRAGVRLPVLCSEKHPS